MREKLAEIVDPPQTNYSHNSHSSMSSDLVQSVLRAFAILQAVSEHPDGLGVSDIAQRTALSTSTVSRLITTLESVNALSRLDGRSQLVLGDGLIELVSRAPWTERIIAQTRPHLRQLAAETRESVGLTRLDKGDCHVFFQISSDHHVRIRDWTGYRFPLHVTSSGKLWMTGWSNEQMQRYFEALSEKIATRTVIDVEEMIREIEAVKESGVAWTIDELEDGLLSVAVQIEKIEAEQPIAIYLSAPTFRFTKKKEREHLARQMLAAAEAISNEVGGE